MSVNIASTAVIDPRANIDSGVRIGHFCVIGPDVTILRGTVLENNVTVTARTRIGEDNHLFPGVVIGGAPQDLSYREEPTAIEIGNANVFREGCTVNRATTKEDRVTRIGDHCFFMTGSHIAHDCKIGDRVVTANNMMLGGTSTSITTSRSVAASASRTLPRSAPFPSSARCRASSTTSLPSCSAKASRASRGASTWWG